MLARAVSPCLYARGGAGARARSGSASSAATRSGEEGSASFAGFSNKPTRGLLPARLYYYARLLPGGSPTRIVRRQTGSLYDPQI